MKLRSDGEWENLEGGEYGSVVPKYSTYIGNS